MVIVRLWNLFLEEFTKDKPFFIEVNSNPGLTGIEETFSKKFSMTEKLLKTYYNRDNWRKTWV